MTTIRRINVSQINGNGANADNENEIRPYGEMGLYEGDYDQNIDRDRLELLIHDGKRTHLRSKVLSPGIFYGSGDDSADQTYGWDTIKLIPDAVLHNQGSEQYIVVDPTSPNHIHLRAGGNIDNSNADLFLGGELNHVRVSDGSDNVVISTDAGEGATSTWTFGPTGVLNLGASIGAIYADQVTGVVSIADALGPNGQSTMPGTRIDIGGANALIISKANGTNNPTWTFSNDGSITLPGGVVSIDSNGTVTDGDFNINLVDNVSETTRVFRFTTETGPGALVFPDGTYQYTAAKLDELEVDGTTILTLPDEDITVQTNYRPTITRTAGPGTTSSMFVIDITEDDDITAVVGDTWEVELGDETWATVSAATLDVQNNTWNIVMLGSVITFQEGTEYTFRKIESTVKEWRFRSAGALVAPGGAILSNETVVNGPGDTYRDFSIELLEPGDAFEHRLIFRNDGSLEVPGNVLVDSALSITGFGTIAGTTYGEDPTQYLTIDGDIDNGVSIHTITALENHVWKFNPNGGFTTPYGLEILDQYIQHPTTGNFISLNNDTGVDIISDGELRLGSNFSDTLNRKFWSFFQNGTVRFPDTTVQTTAWAGGRVVAVPTTSAGASGDKSGDIAFNAGYIYYCTADYGSGTTTTIPWSNVSNFPTYVQADIASPGLLSTGDLQITNNAVNSVTGITVPVDSYELVSGSTYKLYITVAGWEGSYQNSELQVTTGVNIWRRVAWSGDIW